VFLRLNKEAFYLFIKLKLDIELIIYCKSKTESNTILKAILPMLLHEL